MLRHFRQTSLSILRQPNLGGLLASTFALGTAFSFVAPFLSKWGTEAVGLSPRGFSVFMTLTSLSAMVVGTALGRLSDTSISRRTLLTLGGIGGASGFAGYALLRDPIALILIGCTLHALASTCFAQLFSHVREAYQRPASGGGNPALIMSVVRVCFSFSWTVGPAIGSFALIAYGFRGLFLAAAGLYAVFVIGVLIFVPNIPRRKGPVAAPDVSVWRTLGQPDLRLCFIAFAAVFAAFSINMMNLPLALTRTLGGEDRDLGIVFGIGPVVEIPLMLWFGQLASRGHQLLLIKLGMLISLLYFVGLGLAHAPWQVYLLQILSGAAFSILTNVAIVFFQDLIPGQTGLATSLYSSSQAVGNLVGLLSFGFVVEALGHQGSFLACGGLAAVALALFLRMRPARQATGV